MTLEKKKADRAGKRSTGLIQQDLPFLYYSTCRNRRLRDSADTGMSDLNKRLNCSCDAQTCNCKLCRRDLSYRENPMHNSNTIVLLATALGEWHMGKTNYYSKINPCSRDYDPDLPVAFPLGGAANSPRAFTREDVDGYTEILIRRGKEAVAREAAEAAKVRAHLMVAARRARRADYESQARG